MSRVIIIFLMVSLLGFSYLMAQPQYVPPETMKKTVANEYHQTKITDAYQWLEQADNDTVKTWIDRQNQVTRDFLDNFPDFEAIKKRFSEIYSTSSTEYYGLQAHNRIIYAMKNQPPREAPILVKIDNPNDLSTETVLLDLNELDPAGHTSIDFFVPSPSGKLLAVSLSKFGSELGDLVIYDLETGNRLNDLVLSVNGPTAGGDVAWLKDESGFLYTRYPQPDDEHGDDPRFYQQVYFHELGTGMDKDRYVLGKEFPRIAEIEFSEAPDFDHYIITVANGDGGKYTHYLMDTNFISVQVTDFENHIPQVQFGKDNFLYLMSYNNSPNGRILRLPIAQPLLSNAVEYIPEQEFAIKSYTISSDAIYVTYLAGGPNELYIYSLNNVQEYSTVPLPPISSIYNPLLLKGKILFSLSSYTIPSAYFLYDPQTKELERTELFVSSPVSFEDIEVRREFAYSKDGTKIPVNIMMRKGTPLDGNNPTLLYGYGGYGISLQPSFDAGLRLWFDQGGIYVVANIRGGGEYGEAWHLAGNLTKKQNVFDDFIACAEYLITKKYTSPKKLAIKGGSNGGLLMGAALTQRPDLFRVVIANVGVFDMLRVELDANGEFNITEYGTVKDPDQFKALLGYSPYHNVRDRTPYPAVLLTTGANDGRVNPAHSRKMTAALQQSTSSGNPILLRTNFTAGHSRGATLTEKIDLNTDIFAFIMDQMKLRFVNDN